MHEMNFRANEAISEGFDWAAGMLTKGLDANIREAGKQRVGALIAELGPVVDAYPSWHPLVSHKPNYASPVTTPELVYDGVDHTVLLCNGFITCPYDGGKKILQSVENAEVHQIASLSAEVLDMPLYQMDATAVVVRCEWNRPLADDGTIPASIAVPLMLEMELATWMSAEVAETWKTMRSYILGRPCGARSSLFVNSDTGLALKKMYEKLMESGAYGPYLERP